MKKLTIFLMILFVLSGCSSKANSVASNLEINNSMSNLTPSSIPIHYTSAYDEKTLKELGIKLSSTNIVPKIGKLEVRKITKIYCVKPPYNPKVYILSTV